MNKKGRLDNLNFVRSICAIGIVCFHFACESVTDYKFMYAFKNGGWGDIFVIIFLFLSGGVLYYNYPSIQSIKSFYYKRAKAIYPSFYIAFLFLFIKNVIVTNTFFYNPAANPFTLILTALGIDGYFYYVGPNYYILGEWFLGAIVLLYVLYPALRYFYTKHKSGVMLISLALFLGVNFNNVFQISQMRNLITCIFVFLLGIFFIDNRHILNSRWVLLASLPILYVLFFFSIPVTVSVGVLFEVIFGICLFLVLYRLGNLAEKSIILHKLFAFLGGISYQIFLLQHIVINMVLKNHNPTNVKEYWSYLLLTIALTIIVAIILKAVTSKLLKSECFIDFEHFVLSDV